MAAVVIHAFARRYGRAGVQSVAFHFWLVDLGWLGVLAQGLVLVEGKIPLYLLVGCVIMSEFQLYFLLGKDHILDYANGYDHILFVLALCAVYVIADWKQILILVTAFTIGHSITLALATLNLISVPVRWIEFLIPLTILITTISNLFRKNGTVRSSAVQMNYALALFFGLIHGLGFSNYLRALLGKDKEITTQLLAFNVGLEFGQIIIVGIFLTVSFLAVNLAGCNRRDWKMVISSAVAGMAMILMKDRIPL